MEFQYMATWQKAVVVIDKKMQGLSLNEFLKAVFGQ
jgi:hypothetical protein